MSNIQQNGIYISPTVFMEFGKEDKPYGVSATRAKSIEGRAWSNIIGSLPNPDETLKKARQGVGVYKELLYDAQVSSCIKSRKAGVLALEWEFNRGDVQDEITKFVNDCFREIEMYDVVSEILNASIYGYQVMESYYIPKGSRIILSAIVGKPQHWFSFGNENQLLFLSNKNPNGEPVDHRKFTVAKHDADHENPYGRGVLSQCFWPVNLKKDGLKYWIRFCEKYGMPFLHGSVQRGGPVADKSGKKPEDLLMEILEGFAQDGVAVLPMGTTVTMLEATKTSSVDLYERLIKYCDSQISKAILSHSAGVDSTPGQLGNENGSLVVREDIVQSDKRIVESTMNMIVKKLVRLNFGYDVVPPKFEMFGQKEVDMELVNRDIALTEKMNMVFSKEYRQDKYNLNPEDFEIVTPTAAPIPAFEQPSDFADSPDGSRPAQTLVDSTVENLAGSTETDKDIDNLLAPVIELIKGNENFDFADVESKLIEVFGQMDSEKLQKRMERALFVSDMIGRFDVKQRTKPVGSK